MNNVYPNIDDYNSNKKSKILIVFSNMIADMLSNKNLEPILPELFIRGRNLNISLVFITQSYFAVSKNVGLNSVYYFILRIPNKHELQHIAFYHSSDIMTTDYDDKKTEKRIKIVKITEVVTIHCNLVNNTYRHDSRVLHTFLLIKSPGQLQEISSTSFIFSTIFNSEFSYIIVWLKIIGSIGSKLSTIRDKR